MKTSSEFILRALFCATFLLMLPHQATCEPKKLDIKKIQANLTDSKAQIDTLADLAYRTPDLQSFNANELVPILLPFLDSTDYSDYRNELAGKILEKIDINRLDQSTANQTANQLFSVAIKYPTNPAGSLLVSMKKTNAQVLERLIKILDTSKTVGEQSSALYLLRRFDPEQKKKATFVLLKLLNSPDKQIQTDTVSVLTGVSDLPSEMFSKLLAFTSPKEKTALRSFALRALCNVKVKPPLPSTTVKFLENGLKNENVEIKIAASEATKCLLDKLNPEEKFVLNQVQYCEDLCTSKENLGKELANNGPVSRTLIDDGLVKLLTKNAEYCSKEDQKKQTGSEQVVCLSTQNSPSAAPSVDLVNLEGASKKVLSEAMAKSSVEFSSFDRLKTEVVSTLLKYEKEIDPQKKENLKKSLKEGLKRFTDQVSQEMAEPFPNSILSTLPTLTVVFKAINQSSLREDEELLNLEKKYVKAISTRFKTPITSNEDLGVRPILSLSLFPYETTCPNLYRKDAIQEQL